MRARDYIQAVRELIREGHDPEVILSELAVILVRKGHTQLHRQILNGVRMQIEKDLQGKKALVTLAREQDLERQKNAIESTLASLGATEFDTALDSTLIGGFTTEQSGKIVDQSYKKQLLTLYRSLIG